ncbi:MAG: hypothetical protein QHH06_14075 [Clostridiales bacterium]|nr:hypothetical protein [Eubacteriales bacterium]MDH7567571.1 hypothetical protein [Clostridiales bacterium]
MRLSGKLVKGTKVIKETSVERNEDAPYRDLLENCLLDLCRELDIQVPLWLKKNTREFVLYRRTSFTKEHFMEGIKFDRFEIRVE